jgi:hypothetical protein
MKDIIDKLRDDEEYYRGVGKNYLSNSDISSLLGNKNMFKKDKEDNKNFLVGRFFHQLLLEPEKAKDITFVDCKSRNTKMYKEFLIDNELDMVMLKDEYDNTMSLASHMKKNINIFNEIYADGNQFEVPMVAEVNGHMWKGKADIVTNTKLIDLKTTSNIRDFRWSAKKYNYDSQCYIYQELFGKPLEFIVIDKTTMEMGVFEPSSDFLLSGERKVDDAIDVYNRFFSKDATESVDDFIMYDIL